MFCIRRKFSNQQASTCRKKNLNMLVSCQERSCNFTHRVKNEKDVLHHPPPSSTSNAHGGSPRAPIATLLYLFVTPTAEGSVQVEPPVTWTVATIPCLQICQPVARDIDESSDTTTQDTSCNENDPHLARICQLLDVTEDATRARIQISQPLSLLSILKDPINRRKIVVTNSSSGALHVPIQSCRILRVLQMITSIAWCIEVVEDQLCGAVAIRVAPTML